MLQLQKSKATNPNPLFSSIRRKSGQGNAEYAAEHASKQPRQTNVVLVGGIGPVDFRLRAAQSHARDDMQPSAWSHILLMARPGKTAAQTLIYEVSLYGKRGVGYPPATNGVERAEIGDYDDPTLFPNLAIIRVPVSFAEVESAVELFSHQRTVMDVLEHQLSWWAFVWGVGRSSNPLLDGLGIPSAAFIEYVVAAAGYDLVPGFPSRASCPEAIWQACRWWHGHPRLFDSDAGEKKGPRLGGVYDAEQYLVPPMTRPERRPSTQSKKKKARKTGSRGTPQ